MLFSISHPIRAVDQQRSKSRAETAWENGFIESFNARLRDELLDGEIFYSLREAQVVIESWRRTTTAHQNAHLAMLLMQRGFAVRGPVPWGVWHGLLPAEQGLGRTIPRERLG